MKIVGLYLFFFFLFPLKTFASTYCVEKNFIFLLHGVAGNGDTFGYLADYLEAQDPCYEVLSFEYQTGHPLKDVKAFAYDFHEFVEKSLLKKGAKVQDKISLIMHSQGGLVGSMWIKNLKEKAHPYADQLDAFITLSTPFWGAPIASLGKRIFYSGLNYNPISPFGKAELNEMSFGSTTINRIYEDYEDIFTLQNLRPMALAGLKKFSSVLTGEDDMIVPVYSSRPDHYRVALTQSMARGPASIKSSQFAKTDHFKFATIRSNHFNFSLPGIASLPFKCLLLLRCQHPAADYIVKHLRREEIREGHSVFHTFRVQIFLENQTRNTKSFKNARLSILDRNGTWIPKYQALKKYRGPANNKEGKAFTFSGVYLKKGERVIKVKVTLKDKFQRVLEIPVQGGHTSIVKLHLDD